MLKVILDSVARILLFSSWLYVVNNGVFSSVYTLAAYYTVFGVLVIFNIVTSNSRDFHQGKFWIGFCHLIPALSLCLIFGYDPYFYHISYKAYNFRYSNSNN